MKKELSEEVIDQSLFDELLQTAAIDLNPDEKELIRKELNQQMSIIRQLEVIPLDETHSPVIHGNPYPAEIRCELRADEWVPFENAKGIIDQAPVEFDGYFVSPDVPHRRIG